MSDLLYERRLSWRKNKKVLASKGFTLIELAIVMTILGMLLLPILGIYTKYVDQKHRVDTKDNIHEIRKAMAQYYYTYHQYPCPAPMINPDNDSVTRSGCNFQNDPEIKDAMKAGVFVYDGGGGNKSVSGSIPYKLLNIPKEISFDGWGSLFTYTVSLNSTEKSFEPGTGAIGIINHQGQSVITPPNSALWAVVSHGPINRVPTTARMKKRRVVMRLTWMPPTVHFQETMF